MKKVLALIAAAGLLAACSASAKPAAYVKTVTVAPTSAASSTSAFASTGDRDKQFLDALQGSPYVSSYTSQTQENLTQLGAQMCNDIETGHSVQAVVRARNITTDSPSVKFLVTTAVDTYCPNLSAELANLVG